MCQCQPNVPCISSSFNLNSTVLHSGFHIIILMDIICLELVQRRPTRFIINDKLMTKEKVPLLHPPSFCLSLPPSLLPSLCRMSNTYIHYQSPSLILSLPFFLPPSLPPPLSLQDVKYTSIKIIPTSLFIS